MAIERALLSVSDKTGIIELARALRDRGVEILSTGGTAKHLGDAGIEVTPISEWTGTPEILGGRVKTLTPKVFGGILFDRDVESHRNDCVANDIGQIDLVVVNLYPFEATVAREDVTFKEAIEQIDVGGPSMLRAAAKNHRHVVPLSDPALYGEFIDELTRGEVTESFRRKAAVRTFEKTSAYDAAITAYLTREDPRHLDDISLQLEKVQDLRYGENPQQSAGFYSQNGTKPFLQLHGKELSYNNLLDLDAAYRLALAFRDSAAAVIKHTNPCGSAIGSSPADAVRRAIEADPVSAFGGIIALNRPFDGDCADAVGSLFLEVIIAPSFTEDAVAKLTQKKNLRLVTASSFEQERELRSAAGGVLVQSFDRISSRESWKVVTRGEVGSAMLEELEFAWTLCAFVKSNAIVITRDRRSVGVGAGQMSRVDAAKLAVQKSSAPPAGAVAASDAFFPFRDGLDVLADAGIQAVIQPGGSVRDEEVIAAAEERGVTMVFTGERHFRH